MESGPRALGRGVRFRNLSACENIGFLLQKTGRAAALRGWGLRESPPTRVFWLRVLGVLGQGPRGLILEVEYLRKHRLFASENRQGCGIAGLGLWESPPTRVFWFRVLGWVDIAGNFRYRRISGTMTPPTQKHRFLLVKNTIFGRGRPPGPP